MDAVCVVGDVVASRDHPDQRGLLAAVAGALDARPEAVSAALTVGDEFQVVYDHLGVAVRSLAALRLALREDAGVAVRCGIGVGELIGPEPPDAGAPGQSGSAWWHARAAIEQVAAPRRGWPAVTWWVEADGDVGAARAALVALDTLWAGFDDLDVSLARGTLDGMTTRELADGTGITQQSVSRRLHDHGVYGWVRALETLGVPA